MNKLSSLAGVDNATLSKVEKNIGVTENSAHRIFYALKDLHQNLDLKDEVLERLI